MRIFYTLFNITNTLSSTGLTFGESQGHSWSILTSNKDRDMIQLGE